MFKQCYCNWWWRLGLLLSLTFITNTKVLAEVTADKTLGTQVTDNGLNSFIEAGTTVNNTNLFHSFSSFNIPNGGAAVFINDPNIVNIFARVSGGTPSDIQGLISAQGTANLFLMNPNGVIFGKNARLNIGGSFVATTANAIQFPGGAEFSLTSPVAPENTLLSVNPTAFLFNQIANQGTNSIENQGRLFTVPGKSLILLGGRVAPTLESTGQIFMDGGIVQAFGGRVEIGGLNASGTVGLKVDDNNLRLSFPDNVDKSDILLNQSAVRALSVSDGDSLVLNANNISLVNSELLTGLVVNSGNSNAKAGDTSINASGNVNLAGGSFIANVAREPGNSGNINIQAQSLIATNGSSIQSSATQGNSGIVNIQVADSISLSGQAPDGLPNIIQSIALPQNASINGRSLGINIKARNISLSDGALIGASGSRIGGQAGDIKIESVDAINLNNFASIITSSVSSEKAGNISINTQRLNIVNSSQITSQTLGIGKAGDLDIRASNISLDNSFISASALSFPGVISDVGDAGDINITTQQLTVKNGGSINSTSGQPEPSEIIGRGGNINITATDFIEIDPKNQTEIITGIIASTFSSSQAGDITLKARDLFIKNGGLISVQASGDLGGNAGDININAKGNVNANNGFIGAIAEQSNGGNINVVARNINLRNNSDIRTDLSSGNAKGGNIFLSADNIIALEDSDILAFAPEGQGGNITFNTRAVFSDSLYQPRQTSTDRNSLQSLINNGRSDINASGAISGNIIGVPDISFIQNSLTELQNNPIDTNALIANSCIARSFKQEGTFIITGTGGLPNRPGEAMASSYPTGDVQSVTNNHATNSWKKGDPIIEPQGVYRLANGNLVMSRECN